MHLSAPNLASIVPNVHVDGILLLFSQIVIYRVIVKQMLNVK